MHFHKYQALGNDYLIIDDPGGAVFEPGLIRRICDRHFGIGSDGILFREPDPPEGGFALRIMNPDGSEAEKSGNGLRIFARYLWDAGLAGAGRFPVLTRGGQVWCQVRDEGRLVFVEMGRASFTSTEIPVAGPPREVVGERLDIPEGSIRITGVTVGNPHCVIYVDEVTPALAQSVGPVLENHPLFPNRTNVQFVKVLAHDRIQIEIWERGAGYTLASGSSGCAAAAASVRLGFCAGEITVVMPGGTLQVGVSDDFSLTMLGPARRIAEGVVAEELLEEG